MTQETVEVLTELWCLTAQESMGDYELRRSFWKTNDKVDVVIWHKDILEVTLPFEVIKHTYTPKEKAKIIISLLEQIRDNGDQWIQDELDYNGDKLAEKGDNNYKSNKENN